MAEEQKKEIPNWKQEGIKSSLEQFWAKTKQGAKDAVEWVKDNPIQTSILVATGMSIIKELRKDELRKEERELKNNYIYDRRNGHYVKAKRKLSSREWEEYDYRYRCGEDTASILEDMRLLK